MSSASASCCLKASRFDRLECTVQRREKAFQEILPDFGLPEWRTHIDYQPAD